MSQLPLNSSITLPNSLTVLTPTPITLEDRSGESNSRNDQNQNHGMFQQGEIWCTNCFIGEPSIIEGINGGKYALWFIEFETTRGSKIRIRKRYNDFDKLRQQLWSKYSRDTVILRLPPKTPFFQDRFDPVFLEKRRKALDYWLNSVVLNPVLSSTPELKAFILATHAPQL